MENLNDVLQERVQQYMNITEMSDEESAICNMRFCGWQLDSALEDFYNTVHPESDPESEPEPVVDTTHLVEIFDKYKDPNADMIYVDGITQLCDDLQVDPQDIVMVVISWHMKAATMCEFSEQEFITGFLSLKVDTLEQFQEKVPFMRSELEDEQKFREIYNFAFEWGKEKGQKSMGLDTSIEMWKLLFADKQWPLFDHWCQFIKEKHNKAISYDTWSQLAEFAMKVDPELSNYDPEGAWPYLIDDFVDYLTENNIVQMGQPQ